MKLFKKGIGIVSIPDSDRAGPVLERIVSWLSQRHFTINIESDTAQILDSNIQSRFSSCDMEDLPGLTDMILVLGGDGTLLRVAHYIERENIPILGVNLGDLGFLTDVKVDEVISTLGQVMNGRYSLDKRMLLQATINQKDDKIKRFSFALNEIVVNNGPQSRLVHLSSSVDDTWINTFLADGLIISTPTGSTAYSLSAGGPIVHPKLHAILITPICPHILTNRPIVISDKEKITVEVIEKRIGNGGECLLSADGRALAQLKPGDEVEVKKAQHTITLLQPEGTDYYRVLRTKLKWGERG
jgi:NAD+ kinase